MDTVHDAIEAVWKNESARLIAAIALVTQDFGVAEELAIPPTNSSINSHLRSMGEI